MEDEYLRCTNSLLERVEFLKGVALYTDMAGSSALTFDELVKKDAAEVRKRLMELRNSSDFKNLTSAEKERVNSWIPALEGIEEQHLYEVRQLNNLPLDPKQD